jgi:hypothetical protein
MRHGERLLGWEVEVRNKVEKDKGTKFEKKVKSTRRYVIMK